MSLNEMQKREIEQAIRQLMKSKVDSYTEREDMNKPFYFALFSKKSVYIASILQSTYTSFGSQWENIAEIIAKGNSNVEIFKKQYKLNGTITAKEQEAIADYLFELDRGEEKADYATTKERISSAYDQNDEKKEINQIVDFFVQLKNGHEIYFENKSVKPNKNEMKAAKSDLLEIFAIRQKEIDIKMIDVAVSMPYNPYFGKVFERWTTVKFFEVGKDLLIGKEFWDLLGGEGTYEDLLKIFSDVGEQISEQLDEFITDLESSDFDSIKYTDELV